jgi:hypothetical protein
MRYEIGRFHRPIFRGVSGSELLFNSTGVSCSSTAAPNQPTGLTATAVSSSQINLAWTADSTAPPNAATYYVVERSPDGSTGWAQIGMAMTNALNDTGLPAATQFYYRVSAYNCFGGSTPSATANATTQSGALSPSWSLDFSSGTPSGYVLTRASSGTYVDSSGYIASASTDVARLTHNSSGTRLGLLVEEQRQNLLRRSEDFGTTWTNTNTTETTNTTTAPDNTTTADTITESAGTNQNRFMSQSVTITSGVTYTASIYAKAGSATVMQIFANSNGFGSNVWANFNLSNGTLGTNNGSANVAQSITDVGNGWYRCTLTATATNSTTSTLINPAFTNNNTAAGRAPSYTVTAGNEKDFYLWGAQLEVGNAATSYISTAGSAVTRSADLAHVLDSSITSWGDPGALVIHFYPPGQAGTLLSTDDVANEQLGIQASTTTAARAFWSNGQTSTGTIGTGVQKAVHYWNGTNSRFCINGGTVQTGTNNITTFGNIDYVTFGAEAVESGGVPDPPPPDWQNYANCIIRYIAFYSGTLTDANLQTITT